CGDPQWKFHAGVSYRNLLIYRGRGGAPPFDASTQTVPPHDITDQAVEPYLPRGTGGEVLREMMRRSEELFREADVNAQRASRGESPATQIWLWGQGRTPALEPFAQRYGVQAAVITAVD